MARKSERTGKRWYFCPSCPAPADDPRRSDKRYAQCPPKHARFSLSIKATDPVCPVCGSALRKTNDGERFPAEVPTEQEIKALINACGKGPSGIRNRAMLATMWRCGLRVSEALDLYPRDLDLERCELRILHGKGDQARTLGLDPGNLAILMMWSSYRAKLGLDGRQRLFCTLQGRRMAGSDYVRQLLNRLATKAGIEKRVHPHGLRHAFAREMVKRGHTPQEIQAMLGHRHLQSTIAYLGRVAPEKVIKAMQERDW